MKKFIKENWFKISFLLLALIIFLFYWVTIKKIEINKDLYRDCIQSCDNNRECIGVKGSYGSCTKYDNNTECKNICIKKYK